MFGAVVFALCALYPVMADHMCTSDRDCGATECCVHPLFHKRFFIFDTTMGICYPQGHEGEFCEPPEVNSPLNSNFHVWHCPCVTGFQCHGDTEHHGNGIHTYSNPRCHPTRMTELHAEHTTMMPTTDHNITGTEHQDGN